MLFIFITSDIEKPVYISNDEREIQELITEIEKGEDNEYQRINSSTYSE